MRRNTLAAFLSATVALAAISSAMTGPEVLQRIRRAYDRMETFQASFEQTFVWKLAGSTTQMNGRFVMEKPNRFRLETDVQTVVTDGRTVWSYSPATKQVIINDYDPSTMPLRPDNFIFVFPDDQRASYVGSEQIGGSEHHKVDVVPKDSTLGIRTMRLWVNSRHWVAGKVEYVSATGDTTRYVLGDERLNVDLPDTTFAFSIPQGTDVVDFRASATR
jgi:outer membrane lipoprotein carrier protein